MNINFLNFNHRKNQYLFLASVNAFRYNPNSFVHDYQHFINAFHIYNMHIISSEETNLIKIN